MTLEQDPDDSSQRKTLYMTITRAKAHFGLTDSMFRDIGEPDLIRPNPHYRSAAPMRLYLIERLENWVTKNLERVEKAIIRRKKLSAAQQAVHERKRQEMQKLADSWEPRFLARIPGNVCDLAREHYYLRYIDFDGTLTESGLVAFVRHNFTDYDDFLGRIPQYKGQTGNYLLYLTLREKVDDMIVEWIQSYDKPLNVTEYSDSGN
ncbi:MAG: hypothetical protein ACXAB4_00755 [Candidatus Hodarchaeales archaeon]|jgi:hypothetical protein